MSTDVQCFYQLGLGPCKDDSLVGLGDQEEGPQSIDPGFVGIMVRRITLR